MKSLAIILPDHVSVKINAIVSIGLGYINFILRFTDWGVCTCIAMLKGQTMCILTPLKDLVWFMVNHN